jgi:hypothetical protein
MVPFTIIGANSPVIPPALYIHQEVIRLKIAKTKNEEKNTFHDFTSFNAALSK